ncbi:MAG TPA: hypothetical protein VF526_20640 [Solirubrobacteraceae bacterium]
MSPDAPRARVTVTLEDVADLHIVTFTLLLPHNQGRAGHGQDRLLSAREIYTTVKLAGEGKLVDF